MALKHCGSRKGKENAANLSAETEYCKLYGATEWRMLSKTERQRKGHHGNGSQYLVDMGKTCGTNGPAQMGTRYINVGRKNGQKEKWATVNLMARHVQEISNRTMVKNNQKIKLVQMEYNYTTPVMRCL
jgi:hypothetical protein